MKLPGRFFIVTLGIGLFLLLLLGGSARSVATMSGPVTPRTYTVPDYKPAPSRGNLARTGVYTGVTPPALDEVLWTQTVDGFIEDPPFVDGDTLYFLGDGYGGNYLHAVDIPTGKEKWAVKASRYTPPVAHNGVVYYATAAGLHAMDVETQQERWVFAKAGEGIASPVLLDGTAYFAAEDGYLYAVDVTSGKAKWSTPLVLDEHGRAVPVRIVTEVAVLDGTLYFGAGGYFHAIDLQTGKKQWQAGVGDAVFGMPAFGEGLVYVVGGDNKTRFDVIEYQTNLYALDLDTGSRIWKFEPPGHPESPGDVGSPVLYDGVVYFANGNNAWTGRGHLYALDARSGKQFWRRTAPDGLSRPKALSVYDGLVYVPARVPPDFPAWLEAGSKEGAPLYVFDAKTGELRWTWRGGEYVTDATIAGGVLYIGTERGDIGLVHALDAKTGREVRKIETSTAVVSQPLIVDGVIYARQSDLDDQIVAIR